MPQKPADTTIETFTLRQVVKLFEYLKEVNTTKAQTASLSTITVGSHLAATVGAELMQRFSERNWISHMEQKYSESSPEKNWTHWDTRQFFLTDEGMRRIKELIKTNVENISLKKVRR